MELIENIPTEHFADLFYYFLKYSYPQFYHYISDIHICDIAKAWQILMYLPWDKDIETTCKTFRARVEEECVISDQFNYEMDENSQVTIMKYNFIIHLCEHIIHNSIDCDERKFAQFIYRLRYKDKKFVVVMFHAGILNSNLIPYYYQLFSHELNYTLEIENDQKVINWEICIDSYLLILWQKYMKKKMVSKEILYRHTADYLYFLIHLKQFVKRDNEIFQIFIKKLHRSANISDAKDRLDGTEYLDHLERIENDLWDITVHTIGCDICQYHI